jgi:hypothetical protein
MSATVKTGNQASTVISGGAPNMTLHTVRQTALRLAERSLKSASEFNGSIEVVEFPPALEWISSTRISFETTGFNFLGDPPVKSVARPVEDGPIPNVTSLLAEAQTAAASAPAPTEEPLAWDEIEIVADNLELLRPLRPVGLELYHPPAQPPKAPEPVEPEPEAGPVIDAKVETPDPEPESEPVPEIADRLFITLPSIHKSASAPLHGIGEPLAVSAPRLELPQVTFLPLRPPMCFGGSPEAVQAPAAAPPKSPDIAPEPADEPAVTVVAKLAAPPAKSEPPKKKGKRHHRHAAERAAPVEEPVEEPAQLSDEIEAELAAQATEPAVEAHAAPPAPKDARNALAAAPAAGVAETESKPEKKDSTGLGLDSSTFDMLPPPSNSTGMKIALGVVALAAIGGVALWQYNNASAGPKVPAGKAAVSGVETFGAVVGEAGWSTDWATDLQGKRLRQLSFYRPTMQISDYRVEFEAEVEYKAVSWIVRASNTKNYYVLKLNRTGPGAYNLLRFPVVNSKQGAVVEKELPFPTRVGMVFRVRTDVVGNQFSVSMQDKLVDEWTEKGLPAGGFGVANEGVERGQVRTIQVWHLRTRTAK